MSAPWKRTERMVAKVVGGQRVPVSGRGDGPDVNAGWLVVEVKHRRLLPSWIRTALRQAKVGARDDQLPVVVLHQNGDRFSKAWVLMELESFTAWFGGPKRWEERDE